MATKKKKAKPADPLFEAILASPDDDAPRLVWADALAEAGDPRGEFIVLQCKKDKSAPETKREAELLKKNRARWLGPLEKILDHERSRFLRGFLAEARIAKVTRPLLAATIGAPAWALVERLEVHESVRGVVVKTGAFVRGEKVPTAALLLDPVLGRLRHVEGIDGDVLVTLAAPGRNLPFESIAATTYPWEVRSGAGEAWRLDPVAEKAIAEASGLPRLTRLRLHSYPCDLPDVEWLLSSPLASRLEELTLANWGGRVDRWVDLALETPSLRRLVVFPTAFSLRGESVVSDFRFEFRRGADGKLSELVVDTVDDALSDEQREDFRDGLRRAEGRLSKLDLRGAVAAAH